VRAQFFGLPIAMGALRIENAGNAHEMTNWKANCFVTFGRRQAIRQILSTGLIAFLLSASYAYAVDELLPPFGFRWNDSMARVDAVLHGARKKGQPGDLGGGRTRPSWIEAHRLHL
jgi:hypothetical protein